MNETTTDSTKKLARDSTVAVIGGAVAVGINHALGDPVTDEIATGVGIAVALWAWRMVRTYVKQWLPKGAQ